MDSYVDHISFTDQFGSSDHLVVKKNQNMIVELDASKHYTTIQPPFECLNHSILKKALTHYEDVSLSALLRQISSKC